MAAVFVHLLVKKVTGAGGFEPPIYGLGGRRLILWATRPWYLKITDII